MAWGGSIGGLELQCSGAENGPSPSGVTDTYTHAPSWRCSGKSVNHASRTPGAWQEAGCRIGGAVWGTLRRGIARIHADCTEQQRTSIGTE